MSYNKIQVYGLRRSGTNFIESIVLNNFDNNYNTVIVKQNIDKKHLKYGCKVSLKHTLPTFKYSEFIILVYKPYEEWKKSMEKIYKKQSFYIVWEKFHEKINDIYNDKVIVVDWYEAATNQKEFINHISEKFKLDVDQIIFPPKKKMDRSKGDRVTNKNFNIVPYGDFDKTNKTLNKLKKISWTKKLE